LFQLAVAVWFAASLSGCSASFNYVYMAKDSRGNQKTTEFVSLGDEIHVVMEVVGGARTP
jgi:hypothetical protein